MANNGQERRRFPRRVFKRAVGILSEGVYHIAEGVEIGEGGMMFSIPSEISEEHQVLVSFRIPNHGFVVIKAGIKNTRHSEDSFKYGVKFGDLVFQNKRRIRDYIAAKSEQEAREEMQIVGD